MLKCAAVSRFAQNIPYAITVDFYYDVFSKLLLETMSFFEVSNGKSELESLAWGPGMQKSSDRSQPVFIRYQKVSKSLHCILQCVVFSKANFICNVRKVIQNLKADLVATFTF